MLPIVLHSLAVQTVSDFEVIITDNSSPEIQDKNRSIIETLRDPRFFHIDTSFLLPGGCYHAAALVGQDTCKGEFICFPSDDSYYVPGFAEITLKAAEQNQWDLVYCNMLYDPRFNGTHYSVVNVQPMLNSIDKTGFILRRKWFQGFTDSRTADGELIESLLKRGINHGKVPDVLMVHN